MSDEVRIEVDKYGTISYYNKANQLHRLDGPAVELSDGTKKWYQNGKYHRLDGPARELSNGYKEWWQNGKYHRLDGPAYEGNDGTKAWWIEGKYYKTEGAWLDARCPSLEEAIKMFNEVQHE